MLAAAICVLLLVFGHVLTSSVVFAAVAAATTAAVGLTFVVFAGGIDLSIGAVALLSAALSGDLVSRAGFSGPIAVFMALAIGVLCGLLNGLLVTRAGLPPFVATFGVLCVAGAVAAGLPKPVTNQGQWFAPWVVWTVAAVVIVIAHVLFAHTVLGFRVYFAGTNETAAEHWGISVAGVRLMTYAASGGLAALAGVMAPGSVKGPIDVELIALGAVVLGGATLSGKRGTLIGSLLGAVFLELTGTALRSVGMDCYWWQGVLGVVVVGVATVNARLDRRRRTMQWHDRTNNP